MLNTWVIIAAVALAAAILLLLYRKNQTSRDLILHGTESDAHRDYPKEREDARVAHMSVEDRAWETASLQRHQVSTERAAALAEQRV